MVGSGPGGVADENCSQETIQRISKFLGDTKDIMSFEIKLYIPNCDKYETPTQLHYLFAGGGFEFIA